ncbi:MAG: hypothetical protein R2780_03565 [Crocinitomicaceae bacterium]|nr:hypothetical protein [Crocinitomicaceae bacterium]
MRKIAFILSLLFIASASQAQIISDIEKRDRKRKSDNPFSEKKNWGEAIWSEHASHYRNLGWHINPGITYELGNSAQDESDAYDLTPSGLPGYYVEAGMDHLFKNYGKAVHYFDWGIGVKHFGGQEKTKTAAGDVSRGQFNYGSIFARAAIHNVWQLSRYNFIDQSIGANFDYQIYGGKDDPDYTPPAGYNNQGKMILNLHYSLGWGIKVRDGFFIVPTVQTPILRALSWEGFNPGHNWFNSRYQPMIFTIKFAWLFRKKGCPKVFDNGEGKRQSEQYQMQ